jgi:hypothetical protein
MEVQLKKARDKEIDAQVAGMEAALRVLKDRVKTSQEQQNRDWSVMLLVHTSRLP